MSELTGTTPVIQPDYYKEYICLADRCPDTCCKGWVIEVDPEALKRWKMISETDAAERLPGGVRPMDYVEATAEGSSRVRHRVRFGADHHCPMLTKNGLCSIVLTYGEDHITNICRQFPRLETEQGCMIQRGLAVRCAAVLDLLWAKDRVEYEVIGTSDGESPVTFPAKALLDGILAWGNGTELDSGAMLEILFASFHRIHRKLAAELPEEESERYYGQEMITAANSGEVLDFIAEFTAETARSHRSRMPEGEQQFRRGHDLLYDISHEFFEHPVFGPDYVELFRQSEKLARAADAKVFRRYAEGCGMTPDRERKLRMLILEEMMTAVLSVEVADYETVLVRLQWLLMQYLVLRHIIFLDTLDGKEMSDELLGYRIARLFRITDRPDILKISFFDSGFTNWLWQTGDRFRPAVV